MSMVTFNRAIDRRRKAGKCVCWDCLRSTGLTPPKSRRDEHKRLYPFGIFGEDVGGEPVLTSTGRKGEEVHTDNVGDTPEESRHLKEAVRNREVI